MKTEQEIRDVFEGYRSRLLEVRKDVGYINSEIDRAMGTAITFYLKDHPDDLAWYLEFYEGIVQGIERRDPRIQEQIDDYNNEYLTEGT